MDTPENPLISQEIELQSKKSHTISRKVAIIIGVICILSGSIMILSHFLPEKTFTPIKTTKLTSTPPIFPTVTPALPVSKVTNLQGKILYYTSTSPATSTLTISDKDGKNIARLLDSPIVSYAGSSDNGTVIYYVIPSDKKAVLFKRNLSTGEETSLLSFDATGKNDETFYFNASVSSDGNYAVYSHSNGDLSLFDIHNKTDKILLQSKNQCETAMNACFGYFYPKWSPDNKKVIVRKILYEGATNVVINPFSNPIIEHDVNTGGYNAWRDATSLLVVGSGYGPGSLYLITSLDNPVKVDLIPDSSNLSVNAYNLALSKQHVAVAYSFYANNKSTYSLGIYNFETKALVKVIDSDEEASFGTMYWLDEHTLLFSDAQKQLWEFDTVTKEKNLFPVNNSTIITMF